jgi:hypothetical protein
MRRGFIIVSLFCVAVSTSAAKYSAKWWMEEVGFGKIGYAGGVLSGSVGGEIGFGFASPIGLGIRAGGGLEVLDFPFLDLDDHNYQWYGGYLRLSYTPFLSSKRLNPQNPTVAVRKGRLDLFIEGNLGENWAEDTVYGGVSALALGMKTGIYGSFILIPGGLGVSAEAGWRKQFVNFLYPSGFYGEISFLLLPVGVLYGLEEIGPPQVAVYTAQRYVKSGSSLDLPLTITVKSKYGVSSTSIYVSYPAGLSGPSSFSAGRIAGHSTKTQRVQIEVHSGAVAGWKSVTFSLRMKGQDGEWYIEKSTVRVRVVSAAAKPVAVVGLPKENLGDLILPVSDAEAEYRASYSGTKLTILNLASGQKTEIAASSQDAAVRSLNGFFEGSDQAPPLIALSITDKEIVPAESLKVAVFVSDDQLLGSLAVNLNNREFERRGLGAARESQLSFTLPLQWGDNTIGFEVTDAAGHLATKEVTVTRIRGTGVVTGTTPVIPTTESPHLNYLISSSTGTNTLVGGTVGGVVVVVRNTGKGNAQQVKVSLSGDDELCKLLGWSKDVALIESGDSAVVEFTRFLPTDLERRTVNLKVSVTEGRGYSPTEIKSLTLNLVPASRTQTEVELVEDVDHDIPVSGIKREGYALIVGISDYKNTTAPAYARHDAEVFRDYAEKVLGIPSSNIKLLTDDDATTGLLTAQVQDWLANKSGWRVVYFAGHGTFDLANPTAGIAYLLPYDGDPELRSTLISVDWLLSKVEPRTGDTTLVILDACFTGGEGRSAQVAARPAVMAQIPKGHRSIVLASSEGHQASFDYEKAGHGRFTYYLLNGLRGNAAAEGGWIYLGDLYEYVRRNVHETTDGKQTPVLKGEGSQIKIGRSR